MEDSSNLVKVIDNFKKNQQTNFNQILQKASLG